MAPIQTHRRIIYRAGYKYQFAETYSVLLPTLTGYTASDEFLTLRPDGMLTIKVGYAWDGPSGPARDRPCFMRASAVHDALCQLIRRRLLPADVRPVVDDIMYDLCLEDGMWNVYAGVAWWLVRRFAAAASRVERRVYTAP